MGHSVRRSERGKASSLAFVVLLAAAGVVGVAVVSFFLNTSDTAEGDPVILVDRPEVREIQGTPLPSSAGRDDSAPARIPPAATVDSDAPTAKAAVRQATPREVSEQLYDATGAIMFGDATADDLFALSADLLSLIDADAEPVLESGGTVAAYPLLDDPSLGSATLRVRLSPESKLLNEFTIEAQLSTQPGYFTGYPEDHAESSSMVLSFGFDEQDSPSHFTAVTQLRYHHDQDLFKMREGEAPLGIGGSLSIRGESTLWKPITVEMFQADGEQTWRSSMGPPVERQGSLSDDRAAEIAALLRAKRVRRDS